MLDTSIATIEVYNVANEVSNVVIEVSGVMADNSIIAIEVPAKESDGCDDEV